jgi:hypothetical protein
VPIPGGAWQHVALTCSAGSAALYVAGQQVGAASVPPSLASGSLLLGMRAGDTALEAYGGLVDDVRLYSRALSAAEVGGLYATQAQGLGNGTSLACIGAIGVGTFAPQALLDVNGAASFTGGISTGSYVRSSKLTAFLANGSASNAASGVLYNAPNYNYGSNFQAGVYTAPVGGIYTFAALTAVLAGGWARLAINTSPSTLTTSNPGYQSLALPTCRLSAGDAVAVQASNAYADASCFFSGALLHAT